MIIGHVLPFGSEERNLIFSFHMPLFFILTGYTIKSVTGFRELGRSISKNLKNIYLPCIFVQIINVIISYLINGGEPLKIIKTLIEQITWASAVDVNMHPKLGALWFLVVLFWTKIIYLLIDLIFPQKSKGIVYLFLALLGRLISSHVWLPQSMDVAFVAALFIYIGHFMREYSDVLQKYKLAIPMICFSIWMICWQYGIYIEMGTRSYPMFIICIIEAVCGCLCVIYLSQELQCCTRIANMLKIVGQHTLFIMCVHHIEGVFSFYWSDKSVIELCIIRLLYAFVLLMILLVFNCAKGKLLEVNIKERKN